MLLVKLDTGFNIEVDFSISPFHRRLFAWMIDLAVMFFYSWGGNKLLSLIVSPVWMYTQWAAVLFGLPVLFYHLLFEIMNNGQSPGKKAMSIRVISLDGGQPSFSQYLIRWVFRLADFPVWVLGAVSAGELPWWCSIFLFCGIASIILTSKSQRLGDLVAGTIIINTTNNTSWEDTVFTELEIDYQPRYPEVMNLTDRDINTLKSIIVTVERKQNYELARRIAERISTKLKIDTNQESLEFLQTLLKDYNYYSTH